MLLTRILFTTLIAVFAHGAAYAVNSTGRPNTLEVSARIPVLTPTITIDPTCQMPFEDGKLQKIYKKFSVRGNGALSLSLKQNAFLTRQGGTETIELWVAVISGNADGFGRALGTHNNGMSTRALLNYASQNTDLGRSHPGSPLAHRMLLISPQEQINGADPRPGTYSGVVELVLEAGEEDLPIQYHAR